MIHRLLQNKKISLLLCFITFFSYQINAQEDKSNFWNNIRFGGGLGVSFSNGFFSGTLAPSAIYQFNDQFSLGLGLNGTYSSLKNQYQSTVLGGSVISLYNVIPEIQLSAEFEQLNVNRSYENFLGLEDDNYWYPALFVGAGYRNRNVAIGIRYDLLYDSDKSIYAEAWAPFVRVYF